MYCIDGEELGTSPFHVFKMFHTFEIVFCGHEKLIRQPTFRVFSKLECM